MYVLSFNFEVEYIVFVFYVDDLGVLFEILDLLLGGVFDKESVKVELLVLVVEDLN